MRWLTGLILGIAVTSLLTGCTSGLVDVDETVHVEYTVMAVASPSILFINEDGEFHALHGCAVPWRYEFDIERGKFLCVRGWIPDTWGSVTVCIYRDGVLLATETSEGFGAPASVHSES